MNSPNKAELAISGSVDLPRPACGMAGTLSRQLAGGHERRWSTGPTWWN
jgi:hypothetical protein